MAQPRNYLLYSVICSLLSIPACARAPRRVGYFSDRGEKQVDVRSALLRGEDAPRLIHVRDIRGVDFPFDPPIWSIQDITSDDKGHIYFADKGHCHIAITDEEGRFLGIIGKQGPGPFEFRPRQNPYAIEWIPGPDMIVAYDIPLRLIYFRSDGSPLNEQQISFRLPKLAATSSGFIQTVPYPGPIVEFNLRGEEVARYGRLLESADAPWKEVRELYAGAERELDLSGGRMAPSEMNFREVEVVEDSLIVHSMGPCNRYRCWDRTTGEFLWQINLDHEDYEPPTLYKYRTSGSGPNISWERGRKQMIARTWVDDICWRDGFLFVGLTMMGNTKRRKPDHQSVQSPNTVLGELYRPYRGSLEILSLGPDLIAYIPLDVEGHFELDVTVGRFLIIGTDDPEPRLSVYSIEGLWQEGNRPL